MSEDAITAEDRHARVAEAAYALLAERGYAATSMLLIARRSGTSNQTLYRRYGNKQGLFRRLVEDNAAAARAMLEQTLSGTSDPMATLQDLAPVLLAMVTGDRAVILNRAAAGDVHDTGTLGQALEQAGRGTVIPLIAQVMNQAQERGQLRRRLLPAQLADLYVRLLIGDWQIQRVIGSRPAPDAQACADRAEETMIALRRLA